MMMIFDELESDYFLFFDFDFPGFVVCGLCGFFVFLFQPGLLLSFLTRTRQEEALRRYPVQRISAKKSLIRFMINDLFKCF